MVRNQKNPLNTSFRSATHATDSTCSGWIAKSAATTALRQGCRVIRVRTANSRQALAA